MRSRIDGAFLWTLAIGVVVALMLSGVGDFPGELQFAPYAAGLTVLLLVAVLLIGVFVPKVLNWTERRLQSVWADGSNTTRFAETRDRPAPWPEVLRVIAYILGAAVAVFLFGFYAVPAPFIALYLVCEAGVRLRWALVSAVVGGALLVFGMRVVNIEVWTGAIPEIVPRILGGALIPPL